jgi:hypothetical protein
MGPGGTLGLKHGVSRIDDLTTREFASCCGVNLAGCIRVLWFVVWVFGLGGSARVVASRWGPGLAERSKCQLLGTAHCRDLSLARLPSHPHPGTAPFSSPSVGRTAHAGQQGRRFPPHHANSGRAATPVKPTAGVPGTPVLGTPGFAPILIPRPKAGVSTVGFWLRSGQAPAVAVFRGDFRFCRHPETTI